MIHASLNNLSNLEYKAIPNIMQRIKIYDNLP